MVCLHDDQGLVLRMGRELPGCVSQPGGLHRNMEANQLYSHSKSTLSLPRKFPKIMGTGSAAYGKVKSIVLSHDLVQVRQCEPCVGQSVLTWLHGLDLLPAG